MVRVVCGSEAKLSLIHMIVKVYVSYACTFAWVYGLELALIMFICHRLPRLKSDMHRNYILASAQLVPLQIARLFSQAALYSETCLIRSPFGQVKMA